VTSADVEMTVKNSFDDDGAFALADGVENDVRVNDVRPNTGS
jgi:hypothetical protein